MSVSPSSTLKHSDLKRRIKKYWFLYLLFIPTLIYICIFHLWPIIMQFFMAFNNYNFMDGVFGSKLVGLDNFKYIFSKPEVYRVILNTIKISILNILVGFFPPIILSIMLFDLHSNTLRKLTQNILYIPYFFSWVVIYAITFAVFSNTGIVNSSLNAMGIETQQFLVDSKYFIPMILITGLWKNLGWNTIIYMAALTSIDLELFEAAKIDGAGPLARIRYITLPGIKTVTIFVLTLSLGNILNVGTEQILLFYTPATYNIGDIIGTWIYRQGLGSLQYSIGASMSLFQSIIGFALVMGANMFAKKYAKVGIW